MIEQFRKTVALFDRRILSQLALVALVVLVGTLLEAVGIAVIVPFVTVIVEPARLADSQLGRIILAMAGEGDLHHLMVVAAFGLIGIFVLKNAFLLLMYHVQNRFICTNEALLANRLLQRYLAAPYPVHLGRNSAELVRNIVGTVGTVFSSVVGGYITLATELCVVAGILVMLMAVQPMVTLIAGLAVAVLAMVFFLISHRRFGVLGRHELDVNERLLRSLYQSLHSVKETIVLGREQFFLECFADQRRQLAAIAQEMATWKQAPRLWVETTAAIGILLVIVTLLQGGSGAGGVLGALGLYAAAAMRLIPSMNRVLIGLSCIRNGRAAVDIIHADVIEMAIRPETQSDRTERQLPFERDIRLAGLRFRYPGGEDEVLKGIDLTIGRGESIGVVGSSGAGKTTLIDLLLGLLEPTGGALLVDGIDIQTDVAAWRRKFGYVPQGIYLGDDSIRRNVAFGIADGEIDDTQVWRALDLAQLTETVRALPGGLDTIIAEGGARLSGGQRQRIGIARALYHDPDILVFDEATSALDNETERALVEAIQRLHAVKTEIIVAHRLSTVRACDRIVFLTQGRVAGIGDFDELITTNADFRRMVEAAQAEQK